MKKNIFGILLLGLMAVGCSDDYTDMYQEPIEGADEQMVALQNVQCEPFVSSVIFSWDKPTSAAYYYTLVSWIDANGNQAYKKISKYSEDPDDPTRIRAIVGGFTDTNTYTFTLVACSTSGNQSEPVQVSAAPQSSETAKDYVLSTVKVVPGPESAVITWKNEIGATINLVFDYVDKYGEAQTKTIDATTPTTETLANLPIEKTTVISCKAIDPSYRAETDPVQYDIIPELTTYDIYNSAINYACATLWNNPGPTNQCTITYDNDTNTEFTVVTTGNDPYCWWENYKSIGTKFVMRYKSTEEVEFQVFLEFPPTGVAQYCPKATLKKTDNWETLEWDLSGHFGTWQSGYIFPRFDWGAVSGVTIQVRNAHFE